MDIKFLWKLICVFLTFTIFISTMTVRAQHAFNLTATFDKGQVKVTWHPVEDASYYTVYKHNLKKDKEERTMTQNTTINVQDAYTSEYRFFVDAVLANGNYTNLSYAVYYTTPKKIFSRTGSDVSFDIEYEGTDGIVIRNKDKDETLFEIENNVVHSNNSKNNTSVTSVVGRRSKLSVTINGVQMEDAGYIIGYQNKKERMETGVLIIVFEIQKPVISGPQEVKSRETVNLTCSFPFLHQPSYFVLKRYITYKWFRNDSELQNQSEKELIMNITYSQRNTVYTCKVQINDVISTTSDAFMFHIISPASIRDVHIDEMKIEDSASVSAGQSASVTCSVDGYPPPVISWKRNGEKISEITTAQNSARFPLTDQRCGDFSSYTCEAINSFGNDSKHFTVVVLCAPEICSFRGNYELEFPQKMTLSFKVMSNPIPNVAMTFNNVSYLYHDIDMVPLSSFMFNMSLTLDAQYGNYSLTLENEIGSNLYDIQVYLPAKRIFSRTGSTVSFDIEVNVTAIHLIKNKDTNKTLFDLTHIDAQSYTSDKYVANISSVDMYTDMARVSVTINDVQMKDAGYIIGYRNDGERMDTGVLLIVLELSKPVISGPREVQFDETGNLTCSIQFIHQPYYFALDTETTYKWFRNNKKLKRQRGSELMIDKISYGDVAYTCRMRLNIIRNSYLTSSTKSDPFIVQITSPASITGIRINDMNVMQKGETVSVSAGQFVNVTCSADGYPIPSINWKQNGEMISKIRTTQNTAQLSITNPVCGDLSNYSCEACNKGGKNSRYFTLVVFCPPEILEFKGNFESDFSKMMTLSYKVRSNPRPTLGVTLNNDPISKYDVTMEPTSPSIYNMSLTLKVQHGNYSLTLSNEMGINTYAIQIYLPERTTVSSSPDVNEPIKTWPSFIIPLAVSGGVLVIVVTVVILILKWKLSKHKHKITKEKHDSISELQGPIVQDIPCPANKPEVSNIHAAVTSEGNKVEISPDLAISGRRTNPDGLIYIEVAFHKAAKKVLESQVIHGNDDKTIYTTISHTQGGATRYSDDD